MSLSKKVQLTVSGYSINLSSELKFYQNDQIKLIFEINEYGIEVTNGVKVRSIMPLEPLRARLFFETPSGVDSIESALIENNAVTFYLSEKQTSNIGISKIQLQLLDDDGCQITLPEFTIEIRKNIYDGELEVHDIVLYDKSSDSILIDENGNLIIIDKM